MRSKRLVSLMMALIMVLTLFAPTLAWAAEGNGGEQVRDGGDTIIVTFHFDETTYPVETNVGEAIPSDELGVIEQLIDRTGHDGETLCWCYGSADGIKIEDISTTQFFEDEDVFAVWEPSSGNDPAGTCGENLTWSFDAESSTLTIAGSGAMDDFEDGGSPWYSLRAQITSISFPSGLTSIGNSAFSGCTGLETVKYYGSPEQKANISIGASNNPLLNASWHFIPNSIEVTTLPTKLTYLPWESLDVTGGKVTLYYDNDVSEEIDLTADMVSGFDSEGVEMYQTLTVTYEGKTTTFTVTVKWPVSVEIATLPDRLYYQVGESLVTDGGELTVNYDDGSVETIGFDNDRISFSGFSSETEGVKTVMVIYHLHNNGTLTDIFEVTVLNATWHNIPNSIEVTTLPTKLSYLEGEALNVTGGKLTLYYDNDVSEEINLTADMVTGFDNTVIGRQTLTVTYEGKTATFDVVVKHSSCGDNLSWSFDESTGRLTITGSGAMYDFHKFDGDYPPWGSEATIKSVSLPSGLTSIGDWAFYYCKNLQWITIPDSVTSIGDYAFYYSGLSNINIPNNVVRIGESAFNYCTDMRGVTIGDHVVSIGESAFYNCIGLYSVYIPDSVTSIGNAAFNHCTGMKSATVGNGATYLSSRMFYDCTGLTSVTIGNRVTSIGAEAFYRCRSLTKADYRGTEQMRGRISIATGNDTLVNSTWYYLKPNAIEMKTSPVKLTYQEGKDALDVTGGSITTYYDYDIVEEEPLTADMVIGFDNTVVGPQTLTVTYEGQTATFEVEIISKSLDRIAVTNVPTKTEYLEGKDELDVTGGKLILYYNNDTAEEIDMTAEMVEGFNNKSIGRQTLTVTYGGMTATFEVEVVAKSLDHIAVTTLPTKTEYLEGKDALDVTGGRVTLYYNNGVSEETNLTAEMVSGFNNTIVGFQTLTVTAGEKSASFTVEIIAKSLDHIAVTTLPTKTEYLEGKDALDVIGGKLTLYYDNDTTDEIDLTTEMVEGFNNTVIGPKTLTVTYEGMTTAFEVEVVAKSLDHIAVTTLPTKTEYLEGKDALDVTGGRVTLYYNNDTTDEIDIPAEMVEDFNNTIVGFQTLTVTYEGQTATFEVEIVSKSLDHIAVTTLPTKTKYLEGKDVLDVTVGRVTLYFNNDTAEEIDMTAEMVEGFNNKSIGCQTLTVTYGGTTATFEVEIVAKSLDHIAVTTLPTKTKYLEGEDALDVTGGKLALYYNNDTTDEIDLTVDMVSEFGNTVIGPKTLTVTYEGMTTAFEVEVVAKSLDHIAVTTLPTKTKYLEGKDVLDVTGGKLTLYYNNDTAEEIDMTAEMVSGFDNTVVGPKTLTVTYEGMTATFEVEVVAKALDHIAVTTLPTKTKYLEGKDVLDVTGGKLTLYYNNDTAEEIDLTVSMVSGFDNTVVGLKTLTVTYEGKTATFEVEIQPRTYIVTLDANGGSCAQSNITVTYKKPYGTLPVPTRNGFTFLGWWTTKDSGGKQVTATTVCYASGNYILYARWAKSFTVTLNPNGGACDTANVTVTYGKAYGTLPTPTKTGYSFAGWWTQMSEGGARIVSSDVCQATEDFTLYARWTVKTITVTLNPNGGSVSPTTKTVTYGKAYGTLPTPTRSGYTFNGWWTTKETDGKQVTATTVCYASGNYTLYARWKAGQTYTVTLNPNGGTCGTASKTVTYGQAYGTLPVPKRLGYTFAGWWTAKVSGGKKVTASTICYASGNYTLFARWTEGYTMTFDPNGGTVSPTTKVVKYGQQYGSLPTPTRAGYTFAGWWTTKAEGGKQVTSSTVCYASAGYTLYARWTAKKFVVTLNPNGGECATATKTVTYGQAYGTMPVPSPRTGYTFAGWYTAKTGGKKVTATTVCYATGNYTLYARWTPKTYTVTLNPNGGSCTVGSKTVTYGQTYGTLPTPSRDGYAFAGWWTKKDSGGKQVFSSTTCYATGNYTLYARWTKN